jgi:integrase
MTNSSTVTLRGGGFFMDFQTGQDPAPTIVNSTVERTREYLIGSEVEALMGAARKGSRYGHRDATMILIAYRHGLRASEVCDLQWHQVELAAGRLHVRRSKRGTSSVHPLLRALRRVQREQPPGPHVFFSERGAPMAPKSFHALIQRLGERAGTPFAIHPHMLRHGCGYELANRDTIPGRCKHGLGTETFSTRCAIPSRRRASSGISGGSEKDARQARRRSNGVPDDVWQ